ncbi:MAG: AAA family ATPase [Gammaproteobacteria bacterium]|nr:AAA family ATPase [Gammaproteobacteria bacterium]MBT8135058.1 AAA family ATPase [Gammaproteobacteria bacterium]NNJ51142.1 AAA family ATPase [Gammaproteobacteria bacterium]
MYNDYFGFKEAPFSIAPDPRYLYMTAQHREALAHLVYGLNSEGGCILLTGEVGTGKTTMCRCLLEQIPEQANVALVLNPKVSEIELLETICDELNISYPDTDNSVKTYTDRIYEFLIASNRKNEKTVLIIDEAQNLNSKVLEQLRLLTNLETNQRKLLQIIVLGQPELLDILAKPEMRQLAQRITARFHLRPLTRSEVKAYVTHRLAVAGQNIQLFPENSIKLLFKLSGGVPRLINIICDRALLGAYVESQYAVHTPIIKKAATEVFGELKNVEKKHRTRRWLLPAAIVSSIAAIAIASLYYLTLTPLDNGTDNDSADKRLAKYSASPDTPSSLNNELNEPGFSPTPALTSNTDMSTELDSITIEQDESRQQYTDPAVTDAVVAATAEHNNEKKFDDIETILNDSSNDQVSAYQQLFLAWGHKYNNKSITTACKQAEALSLRCLHKQGNLNSLKAHNRPAVLKLVNNNGQIRHITVTSIRGEFASVYSSDDQYTVRLSDLDKYWFGQFILLWHKPEHYSSAITPGDSGDIVSWLNTQFADELPESKASDIYDDALVERVKTFQTDHGLVADGIVGPVTIIHMNTRSGADVPTLTTS